MGHFLLVAVVIVFSTCAAAQCPVTAAPSQPFIPPAPYSANPSPGGFWHGTASLWTWVSSDPNWWRGPVGSEVPYMAKLAYWRAGFDARKEMDPELTVVARRLDVPAPLVWAEHASAVWDSGHRSLPDELMLTGINIPSGGCWEIAAHYKSETLSIVVLLKP
jgi:hypothetical protein